MASASLKGQRKLGNVAAGIKLVAQPKNLFLRETHAQMHHRTMPSRNSLLIRLALTYIVHYNTPAARGNSFVLSNYATLRTVAAIKCPSTPLWAKC